MWWACLRSDVFVFLISQTGCKHTHTHTLFISLLATLPLPPTHTHRQTHSASINLTLEYFLTIIKARFSLFPIREKLHKVQAEKKNITWTNPGLSPTQVSLLMRKLTAYSPRQGAATVVIALHCWQIHARSPFDVGLSFCFDLGSSAFRNVFSRGKKKQSFSKDSNRAIKVLFNLFYCVVMWHTSGCLWH